MTKRVRLPKRIPVLSVPKADEPVKVVLLGRHKTAGDGDGGASAGDLPIICLPVEDTTGFVVGEFVELELADPEADIADPETLEALRAAAKRKDEG